MGTERLVLQTSTEQVFSAAPSGLIFPKVSGTSYKASPKRAKDHSQGIHPLVKEAKNPFKPHRGGRKTRSAYHSFFKNGDCPIITSPEAQTRCCEGMNLYSSRVWCMIRKNAMWNRTMNAGWTDPGFSPAGVCQCINQAQGKESLGVRQRTQDKRFLLQSQA